MYFINALKDYFRADLSSLFEAAQRFNRLFINYFGGIIEKN